MSKQPDSDPLRGSRVLIVEDEALIAEELRERLSRRGMTVVAAVASADAALEHARRDRPGIILMDIRLKGQRDGIDTANQMRREMNVPLVYLTAHSDRSTIERAKDTAPDGYVMKPFHERDLLVAIEMAMHRQADRVSRQGRDSAGEALAAARARYDTLTTRERAVFALVVKGRLNRQIAGQLGMSERTVKAHRAALMKKMQVGSVADLARTAERLGM